MKETTKEVIRLVNDHFEIIENLQTYLNDLEQTPESIDKLKERVLELIKVIAESIKRYENIDIPPNEHYFCVSAFNLALTEWENVSEAIDKL